MEVHMPSTQMPQMMIMKTYQDGVGEAISRNKTREFHSIINVIVVTVIPGDGAAGDVTIVDPYEFAKLHLGSNLDCAQG